MLYSEDAALPYNITRHEPQVEGNAERRLLETTIAKCITDLTLEAHAFIIFSYIFC